VTRTGALSQWKGLAYPFTAFGAVEAAVLAARGVTGPSEVFEGNNGFMDSIAGRFEIDWEREDLERVRRTFLKRYNAEIHSQSALEALLELREAHPLDPAAVERVELDTFQVAYDIIGGGEEGGKKEIRTKEQADHALPYLLAVALLDGQVMPDSSRPTGSYGQMCKSCCGGSRCARRPTSQPASQPSTPAGCASASSAARHSPRRSPTTRASSPGR
jgi:2-methylcitrate dehydratase